jgi:hypothetical protein
MDIETEDRTAPLRIDIICRPAWSASSQKPDGVREHKRLIGDPAWNFVDNRVIRLGARAVAEYERENQDTRRESTECRDE